jgi:methylase of polypeptide subunit release factors
LGRFLDHKSVAVLEAPDFLDTYLNIESRHVMQDFSVFAALLETAIRKKPHAQNFETGYQALLDKMNRGGEFNLSDMRLVVPRGVYPPQRGSSTEFFLKNWSAAGLSEPSGLLLDLGTGSGALAIYAARQGWCAVGSDINQVAIDTARHNARRNDVDVEFVRSDLFEVFEGRRFNAITFSQPFFHKETVGPNELALASPNGELTQRLFDEASQYLLPGGKLIFPYSNCSDDHLLDRCDWSIELIACDYEAWGQYWRVLLAAMPR